MSPVIDTLAAWMNSQTAAWLGWTLIHSLWQGTIVLFVALAWLAVLHDQSARVRYRCLLACGAVFVLLPIVTFALQATLPPSQNVSRPAMNWGVQLNQRPAQTSPKSRRLAPPAAEISMKASARETLRHDGAVPWVQRFLSWLSAAWGVGLTFSLIRLVQGARQVRRFSSRSAAPIDAVWQERAHQLARRLGLPCSIPVLESAIVLTPTLAGVLRPVILIPGALLTQLAPQQLESLIAHELIHWKRRDNLANLLQAGLESLFYYHPAAWRLSALIRREREACCDEAVGELLPDRLAYSRALLAAAIGAASRPRPLLLAAADQELEWRIRRLFKDKLHPQAGAATGDAEQAETKLAFLRGWRLLRGQPSHRSSQEPPRPPVRMSLLSWLCFAMCLKLLTGLPEVARTSIALAEAPSAEDESIPKPNLEADDRMDHFSQAVQRVLQSSLGKGLGGSLAGEGFRPGVMGAVGGISTWDLGRLLHNEGALEALGFTDEQRDRYERQMEEFKALLDVQRRHQGATAGLSRDERNAFAAERRKTIEECVQKFWGLLTPEQTELARNIMFQLNGELSFAYPEVAEELRLTPLQLKKMSAMSDAALKTMPPKSRWSRFTPEQRAELQRIHQEQHRRFVERMKLGQKPNPPGADDDLLAAVTAIYPPRTLEETLDGRRDLEQRRRELGKALFAVLTPEQQKQWAEMVGPPVNPEHIQGIEDADFRKWHPHLTKEPESKDAPAEVKP